MKPHPETQAASFHPPERTLMGPGPSNIPARVLAALARPPLGYFDPAFVTLMEELKALLRYAFRSGNAATFPMSGPGSVGMEMCFVNLLAPGDKVVVCVNGVFGGRMVENAARCGAAPVVVTDAWGSAVDPNKVEDALRQHPDARALAFVQAETSTGVLSDAKTLAALGHRHGCLVIADAVTSLGGAPLEVDAWGIDACYSAGQKCLSCTPGIAPVTFSARALARLKERGDKPRNWFMDLNELLKYWEGPTRSYHHTPSPNTLYALHEALLVLQAEGIEQAWARHRANQQALAAGLAAFGLPFLVEEARRLPQITAVRVPQGVDEKEVRRRLLADYGLEIGAGLGELAGRVLRFGLMGHSSSRKNVLFCLSALEAVLAELGVKVEAGAATAAAHRAWAQRATAPR